MRNRRGVVGGAILVAGVVVLLAATAVISSASTDPPVALAAAAPTAPYTALTLDGTGYSLQGTRTYETVTGVSTSGDALQISTPSDSDFWTVYLRPPTGSLWAAGTYPVQASAETATVGYLYVYGESKACAGPGILTVHEVARTGNLVSAFSATFAVNCAVSVERTLFGEIRWNSTLGYRGVTSAPKSFTFPVQPWGTDGTPQTVTYTGKGSEPTTFGTAGIIGAAPGAFTITGDTCSGVTLGYGETCTVTVTPHPTSNGVYYDALSLPDNSAAGRKYLPLSVQASGDPQPPTTTPTPTPTPTATPTPTPTAPPGSNAGTYYELAPARILDTRYGNGAPEAPVGPDGTIGLQVTGRGGVPSSGVSAVVLNVTTTAATGDSYLTVYPSGVARPTASSLNFVGGWTGANSVTVAVGGNGKVDLYNHTGSTEVIADVVGFYAADATMVPQLGTGGQYQPVLPERLFDSRTDWGVELPGGYSVRVPVSYGAAIDPHIRALVVNVTAVDPAGPGYLATWNGVDAPPETSTLNYLGGGVVPNLAVVPVSPCDVCGGYPSIGVYTHADSHVIVDILGVFDDGTLSDGLRFTPRTPTRITDTRYGFGAPGALGQATTATITTSDAVATADTYALALNVTAVTPSALTFLTVWPAGISGVGMPGSSNLNPAAGQTVPNAVYTLIGPTNAFNVYNNVGSTHLVVDVVGSFYLNPDTASTLTAARTPTIALGKKQLARTGTQPGQLLQRTD